MTSASWSLRITFNKGIRTRKDWTGTFEFVGESDGESHLAHDLGPQVVQLAVELALVVAAVQRRHHLLELVRTRIVAHRSGPTTKQIDGGSFTSPCEGTTGKKKWKARKPFGWRFERRLGGSVGRGRRVPVASLLNKEPPRHEPVLASLPVVSQTILRKHKIFQCRSKTQPRLIEKKSMKETHFPGKAKIGTRVCSTSFNGIAKLWVLLYIFSDQLLRYSSRVWFGAYLTTEQSWLLQVALAVGDATALLGHAHGALPVLVGNLRADENHF